MKRFHVHVAVKDLADSVRFYSTLFGQAPSLERNDYAKWMLEEPRLNFAISARGEQPGVNHLGFQLEADDELAVLRSRLQSAGIGVSEQAHAECCYASSEKHWTLDPQGIAWESFRSMDTLAVYGDDRRDTGSAACCIPLVPAGANDACCVPMPGRNANSCCGENT